MKRKEVKGIGGFLLIYIIFIVIFSLLFCIGIRTFYDISIYYMPWKERTITFLCSFIVFICIINFINIIMLIFIRKKFVISYMINFHIFIIISSIARFPSVISSTLAGENLLAGNWHFSLLIYGVTFVIVAIVVLIMRKFDKNKITDEAMKVIK